MRKIVLLLIFGAAAWYLSGRQTVRTGGSAASRPVAAASLPAERFQCQGKVHCSQMTSCAEATFYLEKCPGTKMDGDNDGVPCEQQHCQD